MPSAVADLEDRLGHAVGLLGVHAGHRLVEQQQARLGAQGAGDLDPLLVAVGQHADRGVQLVAELEELGDLADPLAVHACPPGSPRQPQPGGEEAGVGQGVAAEHQVLGDRLARRTARCSGRPGPRRCRRSGAGASGRGRCSPKRTCPSVAR